MEMQHKDNETLTAYVIHFKTTAKQCAFNNDAAAVHIFVKGLRDAPTVASKICQKCSTTIEHKDTHLLNTQFWYRD